jgi:hypothetical protein
VILTGAGGLQRRRRRRGLMQKNVKIRASWTPSWSSARAAMLDFRNRSSPSSTATQWSGATVRLLRRSSPGKALIGDPHVSMGLSAGDGGAVIWPHLTGYARARSTMTGELIPAPKAAMGLINYSCPPDDGSRGRSFVQSPRRGRARSVYQKTVNPAHTSRARSPTRASPTKS